MKIILSPAKKMKINDDLGIRWSDTPQFMPQTEEILSWMREKTPAELQKLWACNDKIAEENLERVRTMDLYGRLSPAILSYEGIAFQYMAPAVFEEEQIDYIREHLRILSAFYGVVRPLDGVTPYRLEMGAKPGGELPGGHRNLYSFWGDRLYKAVRDDSGIIINLASKEYSKCIEKYLGEGDRFLTVVFCERAGDKLVTKGTYAKMARGDMVRYMAEMKIEKAEDIRNYDRLGYVFREDLSSETEYVFERKVPEDQNTPENQNITGRK